MGATVTSPLLVTSGCEGDDGSDVTSLTVAPFSVATREEVVSSLSRGAVEGVVSSGVGTSLTEEKLRLC